VAADQVSDHAAGWAGALGQVVRVVRVLGSLPCKINTIGTLVVPRGKECEDVAEHLSGLSVLHP
jgi:hypothetical protein